MSGSAVAFVSRLTIFVNLLLTFFSLSRFKFAVFFLSFSPYSPFEFERDSCEDFIITRTTNMYLMLVALVWKEVWEVDLQLALISILK